MKKTIVIAALIAMALGAGVFFGGIKYAQNKTRGTRGNFAAGLQNLSPEERQRRLQQFQGSGGGRRSGAAAAGNFTAGEIIKKDDQSVTVKLLDGSSKIAFFSANTAIAKSTPGSAEDLQIGKQIMISGPANADGSLTAQNIQIR